MVDARQQAHEALGPDVQASPYEHPQPRHPSTRYVELRVPAVRPPDESVRVLTLGETAARLNLSRQKLEGLIAAGALKTLPTGQTRTVPVSEVERLERTR